MSTFTWTADFKAQRQSKPTVTPVKFGDGYELRQGNGLNTSLKTWSLQFSNRDVSEIDDIDAFLEARGAIESFDWTPPRAGSSIKVVCSEWSRTTESAPFDSITATFRQVAEP